MPEDVVKAALEDLLHQEEEPVFDALLAYFGGESQLFASMWATNGDFDEEDDEDLDEDEGQVDRLATFREAIKDLMFLDTALNCVNVGRLRAFEWVSDGMPIEL